MQFLEKLWKCEKTQRYQTCHNRSKKELFNIRTKFSFYKVLQNFLQRKFNSIRNKKTEIFINKLVFFGLSLPEFSKISTYEFWYGYVKPKYGEKAKLYGYRQFHLYI